MSPSPSSSATSCLRRRAAKVRIQFGARIVSGGFSGAVIGALAGATVVGLVAGAAGAIAGTLGGAALRGRLAATYGVDRPAALLEDAAAIGLGVLAVGMAA